MNTEDLINTSKGQKLADLVIKNAKLVNVLSEEIYDTDIAIAEGIIVGIGTGYEGKEYIDANGAYVSPSFIDGHVHLESSMILPKEFAKAVLPSGTTTVITDPHEIANVYGIDGIKFMQKATKDIPLSVYFMLPSCVPATSFETSGYELKAKDLSELIDEPWVLGLAEVMNSVGTINCDKEILDKIAMAKNAHKLVDGHAPLLSEKELNAYIVSGVKSDHECTTSQEAKEKIRLGMYLMIREGTAAKDLDALMPMLKDFNTRKCCFVTDDRHPSDLHEHINGMVRRCVENGVDVIKAIQCASLNTAEYFGLKDLGAIAPGYKADLLILDDLISFKPRIVLKNGKIVVKDGKVLAQLELPIAGLISDKDIEDVLQKCENLKKAEKELGCKLNDPFMTMGFVSLSVIPDLKITDKGLFEYKSFSFVDVFN